MPSSDHHVPLRGRAVLLEPMTLSHVASLWIAAQRVGDGALLTTVPSSKESTQRYVEDALAAKSAGRALPYVIVSISEGRVLGTTRFANIERWDFGALPRPRDNVFDVVEIGWTWLEQAAQRTGINTEAKLLLLTQAFDTFDVERVTLKTDVRNKRSRDAIERIGAKFEGVLRRHLPATDGGPRDTAMYSIVASEWPLVRASLTAKLARVASGSELVVNGQRSRQEQA
jgi:RimJ/RimL family protein N-acetyltransferase